MNKNEQEERILSAVETLVLKHFVPGGTLVLGVSGGLDSVVAAAAVYRLKLKMRLNCLVRILHVNHNLRGEESDGDASFVKELARAYDFSFRSKKLRWKRGEARSQKVCRERRLAWFSEQLEKDDRILLAHHGSDQAETILLRLFRGTGPAGFVGMRPVTGRILRPFLEFQREDLEKMARAWKLRWREDSSNASKKYERNWIRLELLPMLEGRRPGVARRINALAKDIDQLLKKREGLGGGSFSEAPPLPGKNVRLFRLHLEPSGTDSFGHLHFDLNRSHSEKLGEILRRGRGQLHGPQGWKFYVSRGFLLVFKNSLQVRRTNEGFESVLGVWSRSKERDSEIEFGFRKDFSKEKVKQSGLAIFPEFLRGSILLEKKARASAVPMLRSPGFKPSPWYIWLVNELGLRVP